jgi:hypothetical protein
METNLFPRLKGGVLFANLKPFGNEMHGERSHSQPTLRFQSKQLIHIPLDPTVTHISLLDLRLSQ